MGAESVVSVPPLSRRALDLLRDLERASHQIGKMWLFKLYMERSVEVEALVAAGFWFQLSATQGNVTWRGVEVLQGRV